MAQLSVKAVVAHFAQGGADTMNFSQLPTLARGWHLTSHLYLSQLSVTVQVHPPRRFCAKVSVSLAQLLIWKHYRCSFFHFSKPWKSLMWILRLALGYCPGVFCFRRVKDWRPVQGVFLWFMNLCLTCFTFEAQLLKKGLLVPARQAVTFFKTNLLSVFPSWESRKRQNRIIVVTSETISRSLTQTHSPPLEVSVLVLRSFV